VNRYAIGLGSNVGSRLSHLQEAVNALRGLGDLGTVSSVYETEPVGGPKQGPFLNAVATLKSDLRPAELLTQLQEIEQASGRSREKKWGPRTLDLDIIAWTGPRVVTTDLEIPHPLAAEREFVRRPLVEVWPDAPAGPELRADAIAVVGDQKVDRLAEDWVDGLSAWPGRVFVAVQFLWFVAIAVAMASDGNLPEGEATLTRIVGGAMTVFGAGLSFVSLRRLGPGMTALPEPKEEGALIETGPYALARHPVYGGVILWVLGTSLFLDSIVGTLLSLALLPFFYIKSLYEERRLRIAYAGYGAYRLRVRRRMIPFVF